MPTVFVNGSSPYYLGTDFTDESSLLNLIRTNLLTAGWTTTTDAITASKFLIMRATTSVGSFNGWVKFQTVQVSGNHYQLRVIGDLDGTNTTLSPLTVVTNFDITTTNSLYLSADSEAGCICTIPGNMVYAIQAAHFGWLDRIDTTDQFAFMVGHLQSTYAQPMFVMKSRHASVNWRPLTSDFSTTYSVGGSPPAQGVLDRYTVSTGGIAATSTSSNSAFNSFNGQLSPVTSLPILGSYYYLEGRNGTTAYGSANQVPYYGFNLPAQLHFRGNVKFAVTGLASVLGGVISTDQSGNKYISGGDATWQGFRIL